MAKAKTPPRKPPPPPPKPDEAIQACLRDARKRFGSGPFKVEFVEFKKWSSSALGCGGPGMASAQVITPGWLIEVSGGGQNGDYHTDRDGSRVKIC